MPESRHCLASVRARDRCVYPNAAQQMRGHATRRFDDARWTGFAMTPARQTCAARAGFSREGAGANRPSQLHVRRGKVRVGALVLLLAEDAAFRGRACTQPLESDWFVAIDTNAITAFANALARQFDFADVPDMPVKQR